MDPFKEEIARYLPTYLTEKTYTDLIAYLKVYPGNIQHNPHYCRPFDDHSILQGDGIDDMELPLKHEGIYEARTLPCLLLSNSCDMVIEHNRTIPKSIVYTPIIRVSDLNISLQRKGKKEESIKAILDDIRNNRISNIFYLPGVGEMEESFVYLDQLYNTNIQSVDRDNLKTSRLFSLNQNAFYVFLFKLSVHFSRVQENIDRGQNSESI